MSGTNQTSSAARSSSRRSFLKNISLAAGAFPAIVPASVFGANAPSERVNIAAFGVGGRGSHDNGKIAQLPTARLVAVCDAYESRREKAKKNWDGIYGGDYVKMYTNPWEVLARKDIDAVVVATPDHWHTPLAIAAARAGKDMYVEKPLSVAMSWSQRLRGELAKQRPHLPVRHAAALLRRFPLRLRVGAQRLHRRS